MAKKTTRVRADSLSPDTMEAEGYVDVEVEVDTETGEIHEEPVSTALTVLPEPPVPRDPYAGVASNVFTKETIDTLLEPVDPLKVSIRPDGLVYMEQNEYRRRLNKAFGPGAWGLLPNDIRISDDKTLVMYDGSLYVYGNFVAQAIGEHKYQESNERGSYATSAESAKSDCLTRCCKDLGMFSELWEKEFVTQWLKDYAVEVWCVHKTDTSKKKKMWRKKTAGPIEQYPWFEDNYQQTQKKVQTQVRSQVPAAKLIEEFPKRSENNLKINGIEGMPSTETKERVWNAMQEAFGLALKGSGDDYLPRLGMIVDRLAQYVFQRDGATGRQMTAADCVTLLQWMAPDQTTGLVSPVVQQEAAELVKAMQANNWLPVWEQK